MSALLGKYKNGQSKTRRSPSEAVKNLGRVRKAQGDYLFELTLTVGAFRGGLQLEIGKDRLVAPGLFFGGGYS